LIALASEIDGVLALLLDRSHKAFNVSAQQNPQNTVTGYAVPGPGKAALFAALVRLGTA